MALYRLVIYHLVMYVINSICVEFCTFKMLIFSGMYCFCIFENYFLKM